MTTSEIPGQLTIFDILDELLRNPDAYDEDPDEQ
jgi:hypothetical protein